MSAGVLHDASLAVGSDGTGTGLAAASGVVTYLIHFSSLLFGSGSRDEAAVALLVRTTSGGAGDLDGRRDKRSDGRAALDSPNESWLSESRKGSFYLAEDCS